MMPLIKKSISSTLVISKQKRSLFLLFLQITENAFRFPIQAVLSYWKFFSLAYLCHSLHIFAESCCFDCLSLSICPYTLYPWLAHCNFTSLFHSLKALASLTSLAHWAHYHHPFHFFLLLMGVEMITRRPQIVCRSWETRRKTSYLYFSFISYS